MAAAVRQDEQDLQDLFVLGGWARLAVFRLVNYVNPVQVSGEEVGAR
jgi:hypothetical protein